MMTFRRLYWVAEQVDEFGRSKVTGVYTSIQDLIHKGLKWCDGHDGPDGFRLTLVKPDSFNEPLGVWASPRFEGVRQTLDELVASEEYSRDEVADLDQALAQFGGTKAAK